MQIFQSAWAEALINGIIPSYTYGTSPVLSGSGNAGSNNSSMQRGSLMLTSHF